MNGESPLWLLAIPVSIGIGFLFLYTFALAISKDLRDRLSRGLEERIEKARQRKRAKRTKRFLPAPSISVTQSGEE